MDAFSKPCRISWYFCAELSFDHALVRLNQTKDFMAPVLHTLMFPVSYCSPLSKPLTDKHLFLLSGAAVASASSQLTYHPHWLVVRPPTFFDIHFTQPFFFWRKQNIFASQNSNFTFFYLKTPTLAVFQAFFFFAASALPLGSACGLVNRKAPPT